MKLINGMICDWTGVVVGLIKTLSRPPIRPKVLNTGFDIIDINPQFHEN